jgi:hypothetical protein
LPHFQPWFLSKVFKSALHHRLTSFPSRYT